VAILCCAALGCDPGQVGDTFHPDPQAVRDMEANATASIRPDTMPPTAMDEQTASRWRAVRRAILDARPGPVLGTPDDDGPTVFGGRVAATLDDDGRLHVLDGLNGRVVEFDSHGRFVSEFGRTGDGPMEFRNPRDIDARDEMLFITQDGGVKAVRWSNGEYLPMELFRMTTPLLAICLLDGSMFGNLPRRPNAPLQRYDYHTQRSESSFGRGFASGPDPVRVRFSSGPVACVGESNRLVHGMRHLPTVTGYTPQGDVVWSAHVANHVQGEWKYTADGWLETPVGAVEVLTNLAAAPSGFTVASYDRVDESGKRTSRVYLLDSRTGHGALLEETDKPDREIMVLREDLYVTYVIGLYPRLRLWYMDDPG